MATDRELLTELYTKYGSRVYARCAYLLRDKEEARDAMHDVFIKVTDTDRRNKGPFRRWRRMGSIERGARRRS